MVLLCETMNKDKWVQLLDEFSVFTQHQFGFKGRRFRVTNLLNFYSRAIDVSQERNGWVDCIYLDLKIAFDNVSHRSLLWKLKNAGGRKGNIAK